MMADNLHLDLDEIIEEKLIKNNLKYPVEKSAGVRKNTQSCRNVSFGCWKEQKKNSKMSLEGEKMKKRKSKRWLVNILLFLLLLVGLALIFNEQIKDYFVRETGDKYAIANVTKEDLKRITIKMSVLTLMR